MCIKAPGGRIRWMDLIHVQNMAYGEEKPHPKVKGLQTWNILTHFPPAFQNKWKVQAWFVVIKGFIVHRAQRAKHQGISPAGVGRTAKALQRLGTSTPKQSGSHAVVCMCLLNDQGIGTTYNARTTPRTTGDGNKTKLPPPMVLSVEDQQAAVTPLLFSWHTEMGCETTTTQQQQPVLRPPMENMEKVEERARL